MSDKPQAERRWRLATTRRDYDLVELERKSGVPPRGRLGASRNEMLALIVAVVLVALIIAGFWFEARP
jgi:hypothetical protein